MSEITQAEVKRLFEYRDGVLYWKISRSSRSPIGSRAGCYSGGGGGGRGHTKDRVQIRIYEKLYYAHRLIYLYHHGVLPKGIDHIDRNPLNNLIENLRPATVAENNRNTGLKRTNTSGAKGVANSGCISKPYRVQIGEDYIGIYATMHEAKKVYNDLALERYGEYAWLNDV